MFPERRSTKSATDGYLRFSRKTAIPTLLSKSFHASRLSIFTALLRFVSHRVGTGLALLSLCELQPDSFSNERQLLLRHDIDIKIS